jgi:hypothetical protein
MAAEVVAEAKAALATANTVATHNAEIEAALQVLTFDRVIDKTDTAVSVTAQAWARTFSNTHITEIDPWKVLHQEGVEQKTALDACLLLLQVLCMYEHDPRADIVATYLLGLMLRNFELWRCLNEIFADVYVNRTGTMFMFACEKSAPIARAMLALPPVFGLDVNVSSPACQPALFWAFHAGASANFMATVLDRSSDAVVNGIDEFVPPDDKDIASCIPIALTCTRRQNDRRRTNGPSPAHDIQLNWFCRHIEADGSGRVVLDEYVYALMCDGLGRTWPNDGIVVVELRQRLQMWWSPIRTFQDAFTVEFHQIIHRCIPVQVVAALVEAYAIRRESPLTLHLAKKKKEKEKLAMEKLAMEAKRTNTGVHADQKEQPK